MQWTADNIRILRLRLGWSQADCARRLGCATQTVMDWEAGQLAPTPDDIRQLERLVFYLDTYIETIESQPLSEYLFSQMNIEQIHRNDLKTPKSN